MSAHVPACCSRAGGMAVGQLQERQGFIGRPGSPSSLRGDKPLAEVLIELCESLFLSSGTNTSKHNLTSPAPLPSWPGERVQAFLLHRDFTKPGANSHRSLKRSHLPGTAAADFIYGSLISLPTNPLLTARRGVSPPELP